MGKRTKTVTTPNNDLTKHDAVMPGGAGPNTFVPSMVEDKKKPHDLGEAEPRYETEEAVPIFDVHGDITLDDLKEICANNNRRIADTGDASPIIFGEGHTSDEEGSDRPVYGFADNYRIGRLGKLHPRPVILADIHIRSDKYEESKDYPRRSVEFWQNSKFIDSIALLGGTTPARDLGMMFDRASVKSGVDRLIRYEMSKEKRAMADDTDKGEQDKFDNMLKNSAVFRKFMASDEECDEPNKNAAEEQDDEPADKSAKHSRAEQLKVERDEARIELARFRRERETEKAQVADVLKRLRKAERQDDLKQLSYEGYSIDLATEISEVVEMDDATYARHIDRIKKNYQRDPLNVALIPQVAAVRADAADATAHKARAERARKYALQNGCSYEHALEQIKTEG
jgi:hypothetical protein